MAVTTVSFTISQRAVAQEKRRSGADCDERRRGADEGENHAGKVGMVSVEQLIATLGASRDHCRQIEQRAAPAE